jgi:3-oxoacyl-[acyl-carrier protein] reductase
VHSVESNVLGLSGKTAIVTGAGRGIGQATSKLLKELGVNIVAVDQKFESGKDNRVRHGGIVRLIADVVDPDSANVVVKRCVEEFGKVDILVNNAAVNLGGALLDFKDQEWDKVMEVNLKGYRNFTRAVATLMIRKKIKGRIVNVSSVDGMMAEPGILSYSASKGAIIAFTKCLAIELAPYDIRVNSIAPGWCDTPGGTGSLNAKSRKNVIRRIPLRYIAPPDEIARAIVFLASDLARYLTGSIIVVDGGLTSDISIPGLMY